MTATTGGGAIGSCRVAIVQNVAESKSRSTVSHCERDAQI